MVKIIFKGILIQGQIISKTYKNCLHTNVSEASYNWVMNISDRIWVKLDKNTRELALTGYPYEMASFNQKDIQFLNN